MSLISFKEYVAQRDGNTAPTNEALWGKVGDGTDVYGNKMSTDKNAYLANPKTMQKAVGKNTAPANSGVSNQQWQAINAMAGKDKNWHLHGFKNAPDIGNMWDRLTDKESQNANLTAVAPNTQFFDFGKANNRQQADGDASIEGKGLKNQFGANLLKGLGLYKPNNVSPEEWDSFKKMGGDKLQRSKEDDPLDVKGAWQTLSDKGLLTNPYDRTKGLEPPKWATGGTHGLKQGLSADKLGWSQGTQDEKQAAAVQAGKDAENQAGIDQNKTWGGWLGNKATFGLSGRGERKAAGAMAKNKANDAWKAERQSKLGGIPAP